jgi:hypothetical protein
MDSVTDEELVHRARDGDPTAFDEIVERHKGAVFRAALAALRNREDAEDVTQETFITAFRKLDSFRGNPSCGRGFRGSPGTGRWTSGARADSEGSSTLMLPIRLHFPPREPTPKGPLWPRRFMLA